MIFKARDGTNRFTGFARDEIVMRVVDENVRRNHEKGLGLRSILMDAVRTAVRSDRILKRNEHGWIDSELKEMEREGI